jgi:hypothetical protein
MAASPAAAQEHRVANSMRGSIHKAPTICQPATDSVGVRRPQRSRLARHLVPFHSLDGKCVQFRSHLRRCAAEPRGPLTNLLRDATMLLTKSGAMLPVMLRRTITRSAAIPTEVKHVLFNERRQPNRIPNARFHA